MRGSGRGNTHGKTYIKVEEVEATERAVDEETLDTEKKERRKREIKPRSLGEGTAQKGIGGCGLRCGRALLGTPAGEAFPFLPTTLPTQLSRTL